MGKFKKFFGFSLKLLLAGGIVGIIVWRNPSEILKGFESFDYFYLLPAALIYGSHMVVCSWRWLRLTRILQVKLSFLEALSLTFQGYFFSLVIPGGAIGGDVVKMGVLARRSAAGEKMEGAFTILMDRIIGMIALFTLSLILIGPATPLLMKISIPGIPLGDDVKVLLILGLAGLCVCGLAASVVIFLHRPLEKIPPIGWLMHKGDNLTHGMVTRMTKATDIYVKSWKELTFLTIISIFFVHLMTVASLYMILCGLHLPGFSIFDVVVAVTIGNIVGLIPLFPSGVGGRDVVTITILAAAGIAAGDAKTAQLIATALMLFFNLVGGAFFLLDPGRKEIIASLEKKANEQSAA